MRLANADVLPFEFTNFTDTVEGYINEVKKLAENLQTETKEFNQMLADGTFAAVLDPKKAFILPKPKDDVPDFIFKPLQRALDKLNHSANEYERATKDKKLSPAVQSQLDVILYQSERALLTKEGLPRRDWFKHQIYAPGFYTGYGVKTLPAIREALEQRKWLEAQNQVEVVAKTIENFANEIDKATNLVRK